MLVVLGESLQQGTPQVLNEPTWYIFQLGVGRFLPRLCEWHSQQSQNSKS